MLEAEWDADYCHTQYQTQGDVHKGYLYAAQNNPQGVHQDGQAAAVVSVGLHLAAERPQCEATDLEQLHAERNADDCNAEQEAYNPVIEGDDESAQDDP